MPEDPPLRRHSSFLLADELDDGELIMLQGGVNKRLPAAVLLAAIETAEVPNLASQEEAEEGTENTKIMTPLRVAQAIAELAGVGDALVANTLDQFADVTQAGGTTLAISANTVLSGGTHSGTNTGDQDLSGLAVKSNNLSDLTNAVTARSNLGLGTAAQSAAGDFATAAQGTDERVPTAAGLTTKFGTNKASLVDGDKVAILDSAAADAPKHGLWSLVKSTLKTYFDALYALAGHNHSGVYAPVLGSDDNYVTDAEKAALHARSHAMTSASDHIAGNHKVFYSNGSGRVTELVLGADGTFLKSNGASSAPSFGIAPSSSASVIVTEYGVSGSPHTHAINASTKMIKFVIIGGGGGGGSGRRGAASTARIGGSGGGGAALVIWEGLRPGLPTDLDIFVGAGGAGGAAVAVNSTSGSTGSNGNSSWVDARNAGIGFYIEAVGGAGGGGGSTTPGAAGAAAASSCITFPGSAAYSSSAGGAGGGASSSSAPASTIGAPSGGGGGGGINASNTVGAGSDGGAVGPWGYFGSTTGGVGGAGSVSGSAGLPDGLYGGTGGGGGGGSKTTDGGNGGAGGGYGSGGGGGGGALNGFTPRAGGAGAPGRVIVIEFL